MPFGTLVRRITALVRWRRRDRDLRDEMALHMDLRAARDVDRGLSAEQSAERARAAFGQPLRHREDAREAWGWMWLDRTTRDVRLAVRALRRTPAFTFGSIVSLTLGFAITASAVAVMNAYLRRPLPYPFSDRVFHVMYAPPGPWEPNNLQQLDWSAARDLIEYPLVSSAETFNITDGHVAEPIRARRVSFGVLAGLDLRMTAGRPLLEPDFRALAEQAAVIGQNLWRGRFGSDPAVIGRTIDTETDAGRGERFRIVGVLPPNFYIGGDSRQPVEMVVPFTTPVRTYYLVRLRAGVPPEMVESRLTEAVRQVSTDVPADWTGVHLESARERYAGAFRPVLTGVTAAAALVLVIVFANVAVLTVLRTTRRQAEVAVRLALGASRGRLAGMLATEACLIAAASLSIGLLLTHLTLGFLAPSVEIQLGRPAPGGTATIGVDTTVFVVVTATGLLLAACLSFVPLLVARSAGVAGVLRRTGAAVTSGRSTGRWRSAMLAAELAVTLVLLVGSGVMVQSALTMVRTDLGFEPDQLTQARIALRATDYADAAAYSRVFEQFTRRTPAVTGFPVVFSSWPTFVDFPEHAIEIDGREGVVLNAGAVSTGPAYFATMGISLRQGRDFTWDDLSGAAPVAVISESLATRLWPGGSAIGRRIRQVVVTAGGPRPPGPWQTVIGVATDVRQSYGDGNLRDIYTPWLPDFRFGSFFLRTGGRTEGVLPVLRSTAAAIDPRAVVDFFHATADDNRELSGTTFLSGLLTVFAGVAVLIAILGIYAVTAYAAQQREREVAIRMALGADRRDVVWLFLRNGGAVLLAGLVLGLAGATAATRVLEHQVFAIDTFGRAAMTMMCVVLAAPCLAATWWPARRASRRNPTTALKDV
jgi:predicted permease